MRDMNDKGPNLVNQNSRWFHYRFIYLWKLREVHIFTGTYFYDKVFFRMYNRLIINTLRPHYTMGSLYFAFVMNTNANEMYMQRK